MSRTIKKATIKALHHPGLESLKAQVLTLCLRFPLCQAPHGSGMGKAPSNQSGALDKTPAMLKTDPSHLN
jgi:hypothetical protein